MMTKQNNRLDQLCINSIRFLSADAIQHANSGHPGAPMGAAPMAYMLWNSFLKHNPRNPQWPDRDRFVLSAGHASMLLYSLLHLTGYDVSLEDIRNFRQWGSKTPGHPEYGLTPGVEVTTGPLGQGLGHAVGMAAAEAHMAARFNRKGHTIVDHRTYVLASDGDLMEGVASEACSLAGHLRLGKLTVLFDDNRISLAGSTSLCFTEDIPKRFEAYGWHVVSVDDGNDLESIHDALETCRSERDRPSLMAVRTEIGFGSPAKQGSYKAHGSPLGSEELLAAKAQLDWPTEPDFFLPEEAVTCFRQAVPRGEMLESEWNESYRRYVESYPEPAQEFNRLQAGDLPSGFEEALPVFKTDDPPQPTRKTSETVLQALADKIPELIGGSADLNPSCFTWLKERGDFQAPASACIDLQGIVGGSWDYAGRNLHFGVREHAMGAFANGLSLHGGSIPFTGTFLTFSDYMRPSIRLAALMGLQVIFVFTHDSIGVGEDGPTHQPIEQVMSLRTIPGLTVIRPADSNETVEAWRTALTNREGPTALIFSRQKLPVLDRDGIPRGQSSQKGAYVLWSSEKESPRIILIATGSEVHPALAAAKRLTAEGIGVRVVSMPSWELFERQDASYRESVLPPDAHARVSIEAGVTLGWARYTGPNGLCIGLDRFGASAPADVLFEKFGLKAENIVEQAKKII